MSRHAIISGGSSGIGAALAQCLAAEGWSLTLLARTPERLTKIRDKILKQAPSAQIRTREVDVRDAQAVASAVASAVDALGGPELVVTSAGIVEPGLFRDFPADAFQTTMEVNYFGTLNVVRAALPSLRARRNGHVVLISSGAGLMGLYGYSTYAPSKFAVRGLAEVLRAELRPEGINVSIVYPPDTDTPQLEAELKVRPEATSRIAGGAKVLSADDVARSIIAGVKRQRFIIAPGLEMSLLARLHSLIAPILNRYFFDPIVTRLHPK